MLFTRDCFLNFLFVYFDRDKIYKFYVISIFKHTCVPINGVRADFLSIKTHI